MSYNGTGTFNINTAGQPVVTGTTITSTAFNLLTADLASGLTTAITKDGQTTPTANIPMGGFKVTGLGAGTAATDAAQYGQLQAGATTIATIAGTDAITGSLNPALTAYATGNLFSFVASATNTGAVTINLNSLGVKSITKQGSTALVAGDIVSGRVYLIEYDGTQFQLINAPSAGVSTISFGSTGLTPSSATGGAVTVAGTLAVGNGGTNATTAANARVNLLPSYTSNGGKILAVNSGATDTEWVAASGAWTYLSTVTASNSATVDIETTIDSTYQTYVIIASSVKPVTSTVNLLARQKQGGSYLAEAYQYHFTKSDNTAATYKGVATGGGTSYLVAIDLSNAADGPQGGASFIMYVPNPSNTTLQKGVFSMGVTHSAVIDVAQMTLSGANAYYSTAVTGIRFLMSSGNISSGTFRLYGIKNS